MVRGRRRRRRGWSLGRIMMASAMWRIGEILAIPILICCLALIILGLGAVGGLVAWLGTIVSPGARLTVGLVALTVIVLMVTLYRALINSGWWGAHRHHIIAASLLVLSVGILVGASYSGLLDGA